MLHVFAYYFMYIMRALVYYVFCVCLVTIFGLYCLWGVWLLRRFCACCRRRGQVECYLQLVLGVGVSLWVVGGLGRGCLGGMWCAVLGSRWVGRILRRVCFVPCIVLGGVCVGGGRRGCL